MELGVKQIDYFFNKYCVQPGTMLDVGGEGAAIENVVTPKHVYEQLNIINVKYNVKDTPYNWFMIPNNTYDYVISTATFEHIEFPWLTFLEMVRVTKPGGYIFIFGPGSGPIHRNPFDCWRVEPDGFKALGKLADVDVLEVLEETTNMWCYCSGIYQKRGMHE
jgi:SAM-dependent methyltransferase